MRPEPIDLSRVSTYPIAERRNKVSLARDFADRISSGMSVSDLLAALPNQLGGESLNAVIDAVVRARRNNRPVVIAIGRACHQVRPATGAEGSDPGRCDFRRGHEWLCHHSRL